MTFDKFSKKMRSWCRFDEKKVESSDYREYKKEVKYSN